jgi:hypothetical protein
VTRSPFVESAALVDGFAAHVIDRVLARYLPRLLESTPFTAEQRAELEAARAAIRTAAQRWEQRPIPAPMSAGGHADIVSGDIAACSPEELTAAQVAELLGVSIRHARRLAASGMGRQVAGRWLLDRSAVLAHRERRTA